MQIGWYAFMGTQIFVLAGLFVHGWVCIAFLCWCILDVVDITSTVHAGLCTCVQRLCVATDALDVSVTLKRVRCFNPLLCLPVSVAARPYAIGASSVHTSASYPWQPATRHSFNPWWYYCAAVSSDIPSIPRHSGVTTQAQYCAVTFPSHYETHFTNIVCSVLADHMSS